MRQKIIEDEFEDPVWLSIGTRLKFDIPTASDVFTESRNLLKNILVKDVTKRFTIPQILADSWFTSRTLSYEPELPVFSPPILSERPSTPINQSRSISEGTDPGSSEASTQESSPFSAQPELISSTPTTPDHSNVDPFGTMDDDHFKKQPIQRHSSNSTIRRMSCSDLESLTSKLAKTGERQPATVMEEDVDSVKHASPPPVIRTSSSKGPPSLPVRTPARTKRRSVSSIMSETGSPIGDKTPTPLPISSGRDVDFMSMLTADTPVMFSTLDERRLLNTLASLGFDTAQIVHSVLSYACDSAGALWWILRKKELTLADIQHSAVIGQSVGPDAAMFDTEITKSEENIRESKTKKKKKANAAVQTEAFMGKEGFVAPQFALVPPTPTTVRPTTPPRNGTPSWSPLLSPTSSSTCADSSTKSHPSTPSGSLKDKDKDHGSKGRKARAGSVSIMQRATTALEAAGLVRKKSTEAVRDERERDNKSRDADRHRPSNEESRLSHGSASSKLTKSPPMRPAKEFLPPSTPPPSEQKHSAIHMGSPWILAEGREVASTSAIAAMTGKEEMLHSLSTPNISETTPKAAGPLRNKSNLLATFRLWFNEERRGKRKENAGKVGQGAGTPRMPGRRNSAGKFTTNRGRHRAQRPSMSSHRSSSVNSRRSSLQSAHMAILESPVQTRKSLGSHTPNSELVGEYSSRPSSIRSFSTQQRHRKSPSQSSAGSIHLRTSSPMQKYHRRGGSGSSTRVVRQITPMSRPLHGRSNSATSSLHSPPSSRPASFYEQSETEGSLNIQRTASPYRSRRRSTDDSLSSARRGVAATSTFVAQKRQGPFASPAQIGRSSWKKSWGIEPPGWSSRTVHLPIEVIDISPSNEPISIRDVFSAKTHTSIGDESDWVDEDDDIPTLAGGLGQMGTSISMSSNSSHHSLPPESQSITLSPAPRGQRSKRNQHRSSGGRSRSGHSPAPKSSPLPPEYDSTEARTGRRQLPATRPGPAFKHAIQEEDEDEEE